MIDAADLERACQHTWYAFLIRRVWYAATSIPGHPNNTYLHRFIDSTPPGLEVDHRNGDGLDNRRDNLRRATHAQNLANQQLSAANTSGYKGVVYLKRDRHWAAQTKHHGTPVRLGVYEDKEIAAYAYDLGMITLHGEFARLNLIKPGDDLAAIRALVDRRRLQPHRFAFGWRNPRARAA